MADDEFPVRFVQPPDPNIGLRVDGYFVIRALLGTGGMGAAYLAEHVARSTVRCVVKLVLADFAKQPVALTRYRSETTAVSLLTHDNIVKLHTFGVLDDGQMYMRFEYIEGKSLYRHIAERGGHLSIGDVANLIFQLCDALEYAHECGVIHRDLKPDNVMVEFNPNGSNLTYRVKLLDFGIAKVTSAPMEQHTASGVTMGTPRFMAPEQVSNAAGVSGKADVFSLGTICYLCITAELPWGTPDSSDAAIYYKQRTEPPIVPPESVMPSEVREVVFRTLSVHPDDRPTPREFAVLLAAAIRPETCGADGTKILHEVNKDWATTSPPHIPTLPRPVAEPNAPEMPSEPAVSTGPDALPAVLVHAPESATATPKAKPSPDLTITAKSRPRAIAAAADRTTSPTGVEPISSPASESVAASAVVPALSPPPRHSTPRTPITAGLPTGLVSQRFDVQQPPMESRAPSVVVASEIEMASGTPEPQPYAHVDLPSVLVSNTQLTGAAPSPVPVVRPAEAPPFIVLPHAMQRASAARARIRLVLLGACACVSAAIVVALLVAHLRSSAESPGAGPLTAAAPDSVALRPTVQGDRTRVSEDETQPRMVATAESGMRPSGAIAPTSLGDVGARDGSSAASAVPGPIAVPKTTFVRSATPREPSVTPERTNPDAPTASAATASVSPPPSSTASAKPPVPALSTARPASMSRTSDQAATDEASGARVAVSARRSVQTPPNPADQSPPSGRAPPATRAAADVVSEVTLVIRVKGFAAVSIDGDEPSASPRRKRVQAGTHHVVMTGYPDGADEKKTREFDVNVPAGREETIIHKTW